MDTFHLMKPDFEIIDERETNVRNAFRYCEAVARRHYENFPVASLLIPRSLRPFVASIYAFARQADDFADEGTLAPEDRLRLLSEWEERLDACFEGSAEHPIFVALAATVQECHIPKEPLFDLLRAFRMDVTTKRFPTFAEVAGYCVYSANPIGRLVLHIFREGQADMSEYSDDICTALQLANFWQDIAVDLTKDRVYIPLEDLGRFGYTERQLRNRVVNEPFRELMKFQVERTKEFFIRGRPLLRAVSTKRLRHELEMTWNGGMTILRKIEAAGYDVFRHRPRITHLDTTRLLMKTLLG